MKQISCTLSASPPTRQCCSPARCWPQPQASACFKSSPASCSKSQPAEWTEVLFRFTLIWMVFMGIPITFRQGAMVSVDVLYR